MRARSKPTASSPTPIANALASGGKANSASYSDASPACAWSSGARSDTSSRMMAPSAEPSCDAEAAAMRASNVAI